MCEERDDMRKFGFKKEMVHTIGPYGGRLFMGMSRKLCASMENVTLNG